MRKEWFGGEMLIHVLVFVFAIYGCDSRMEAPPFISTSSTIVVVFRRAKCHCSAAVLLSSSLSAPVFDTFSFAEQWQTVPAATAISHTCRLYLSCRRAISEMPAFNAGGGHTISKRNYRLSATLLKAHPIGARFSACCFHT